MSRAEVDAWLAASAHPLAPALVELCDVVRSSDARVVESIKADAPSFAIRDHFATARLDGDGPIRLVLHNGATATGRADRLGVEDPESLLEWAGPERAVLTFRSADEVAERREAVGALLTQWIALTQ